MFNKGNEDASSNNEEVNQEKIHLATCALLLELANVDGEFSDEERDNIISNFKTNYKLPEKDINELIEASAKELDESIDLWQFTNLINQNYSLEQKLKVIETVWKVAYSDGRLDQHEDYLVHKVAKLLRLSHKQLIDTKLKVLNNDN
jgi:uncharacterized tellurite resistance protein B-like protein